jgi:predicted nucleic acid-binding protein
MFLLDASAVLNLLGTAAAPQLLRGLACQCIVEERVVAELKYHPIPGYDIISEFDQLTAEGLLSSTKMSDHAYEVFLALAGVSGVGGLGIGESAAIAVAQEVGGIVVLDDRKARKHVRIRFPALQVTSSTRLFLQSALGCAMGDENLRTVFLSAQTNASMGILKEERPLVDHLRLFE